MAVNIHITIIELNALHTKRQNLFQELDAVIHLLMEAKHWGLRKSRNATSLNSRFKSLDTLKVKIISVTFRRVIRTNHKKASKIWRHENIQLGGCLLLSLLLPSLLIMFIPSTFKRPVSSWKALNLRKTLLMASSVRLKPLNCSRLPCVYAQETLTFLLTQKKTCVKNYVQKE